MIVKHTNGNVLGLVLSMVSVAMLCSSFWEKL